MNQIARSKDQVAAAVRRRRKALKLTQGDLEAKSGVRQSTISQFEGGAVDVRLGTLIDLLAALDLELVIRARSSAGADDIEALF